MPEESALRRRASCAGSILQRQNDIGVLGLANDRYGHTETASRVLDRDHDRPNG